MLFLIFTIGLIVYKWDIVIAKYQRWTNQLPSEESLWVFNNDPMPVHEEYYNSNSDSTITMLFLGNSITYCTMPPEEEDKTMRGLTATKPENDYVHQLVKLIGERSNVNVKWQAVNIADFERFFTNDSLDMDVKLADINSTPDYLVVQIGENVQEKDIEHPDEFRKEYNEILSKFPGSKRIITLPFWPSKNKQNVITQIALDSGCRLVDLSHLGSGIDPDNFAKTQKHYSNPGVGMHPGDIGMKRIAENIFTAID